jgi:hypothetical protein
MAWNLLFGSDSGLMTVFVIVFTVGMSIGFAGYFAKKMREDEAAQKK